MMQRVAFPLMEMSAPPSTLTSSFLGIRNRGGTAVSITRKIVHCPKTSLRLALPVCRRTSITRYECRPGLVHRWTDDYLRCYPRLIRHITYSSSIAAAANVQSPTSAHSVQARNVKHVRCRKSVSNYASLPYSTSASFTVYLTPCLYFFSEF